MKRIKWWLIFLADVFLIVWTSAIAGIDFGVHAFIEDVAFAWNRKGR